MREQARRRAASARTRARPRAGAGSEEAGVGANAGCITGGSGRCELIVPAATYTVQAGGEPSPSNDGRSYVEARVGDVKVDAGETVRGIDLVLVRGGVLSGVVRSSEPVLFPELSIAPADRGGTVRYLGSADENGAFRIAA